MSRTLERTGWGARPAKWVYDKRIKPVRYVYIHHSAAGVGPGLQDYDADGAPDAEEAHTRGIQSYHMDTKGWSDGAYSFGFGQSGWCYEIRGWDRQSGGTGSPEDSVSVSFCAYGNFELVIPSAQLKFAMAAKIAEGVRLGKIAKDFIVKGDRDVNSTACPGKHLYSLIAEISFLAHMALDKDASNDTSGIPAPSMIRPPSAPKPVLPNLGTTVLREGDPANVYAWRQERIQAMQLALGYLGYGLRGSGPWGPRTTQAVKSFQRDRFLVVDGLVGPLTWAALRKALA